MVAQTQYGIIRTIQVSQMAQIPVTSTTLLRDISGDALHARWGEFVARYRPMMEAFLRERFPGLEADDIVQETLIALVEKLPQYKYVPEETGHFHNYLTGVLKRKALRVCARDKRRAEVMEDVQNEPPPPDASSIEATEEQNWRESIYEIALEQVLADDSIQSRTKQIFLRTAVDGEKPEDVAESFGIKRNAVDQAKNRIIEKIRALVEQLGGVDGHKG